MFFNSKSIVSPLDFAKTVFQVFQTSTVPEFNEVFHKQALEIQTRADLCGTQPRWPSVSAVVQLATNTFCRLKQSGAWDCAVRAPPGAFLAKPHRALMSSHPSGGGGSGSAVLLLPGLPLLSPAGIVVALTISPIVLSREMLHALKLPRLGVTPHVDVHFSSTSFSLRSSSFWSSVTSWWLRSLNCVPLHAL